MTKTYDSMILNALQQIVMICRFLFILTGPILSFIFILFVATSLFYKETQTIEFPIVFKYSIVSGLISILFAITLNSRGILIALLFYLELGEQVGTFFFAGIIVPVIEETAKALPVFYISRALVTETGKTEERRLIQSLQTPVYVSILIGGIFNCLETYWYTWNLGYIFDIENQENWHRISFQIILRSLNPLHIFATSISGFGIGYALWNSKNKSLSFEDYRPALPAFLAAIALHSIWNSTAVLAADSEYMIYFFGDYIPIFNLILIIFALIVLPIFWLKVLDFNTLQCSFCQEWHSPPYSKNSHIAISSYKPSMKYKILTSIGIAKKSYRCPNCLSHNIGSRCNRCEATKLFNCSNCHSPIPVYQDKCWKCKKLFTPVFDGVMEFDQDIISVISSRFIFILAGFYIPSAISILILLTREINKTEYTANTLDSQAITFLFLLILGLAMLVIIKWLVNKQTQAMGLSLARMVMGMIVLQFAIIFIFIGLFFVLLVIESGAFEMIITSLLFIIEGIIIVALALEIIFNFSPVFHTTRSL